MEFKRPTRHDGRPSRLAVPERRTAAPRPVQPVRQPQAPPTPTATTSSSKKTSIVTTLRQLLVKKRSVMIASIVGVLTVGSLAVGAIIQQQNNEQTKSQGDILENLEYQTVLPSGKNISELGGWKRVSPDKSAPVYAYTDKIGDVAISVSQQPLPDSFLGSNNTALAELAKSYSATKEIDASGTKVYVGTSAKGPQSVLLTKNGLLIMIKSQKKIEDKAWASYVSSLN